MNEERRKGLLKEKGFVIASYTVETVVAYV